MKNENDDSHYMFYLHGYEPFEARLYDLVDALLNKVVSLDLDEDQIDDLLLQAQDLIDGW